MEQKKFPGIALGTWSWGVGAAGGDQVFGNLQRFGTDYIDLYWIHNPADVEKQEN